MSLISQLVEEIEEIRPKWKLVSEEYPSTGKFKVIVVYIQMAGEYKIVYSDKGDWIYDGWKWFLYGGDYWMEVKGPFKI